VYVLCTTWFGAYYWLRMPMLAGCIRTICVFYPVTGPALNPMLGTTFALFKTGCDGEPHTRFGNENVVLPCICDPEP